MVSHAESRLCFFISGVTREDQSNAAREELKTIVETIKMRALEN